jgi:hypothetical protein
MNSSQNSKVSIPKERELISVASKEWNQLDESLKRIYHIYTNEGKRHNIGNLFADRDLHDNRRRSWSSVFSGYATRAVYDRYFQMFQKVRIFLDTSVIIRPALTGTICREQSWVSTESATVHGIIMTDAEYQQDALIAGNSSPNAQLPIESERPAKRPAGLQDGTNASTQRNLSGALDEGSGDPQRGNPARPAAGQGVSMVPDLATTSPEADRAVSAPEISLDADVIPKLEPEDVAPSPYVKIFHQLLQNKAAESYRK